MWDVETGEWLGWEVPYPLNQGIKMNNFGVEIRWGLCMMLVGIAIYK